MYISDIKAKEMICDIGRKMYAKQFVNANDGNITIRTGENTVIITPTGVSKGSLTKDMLLKVDFDGNILDGTYQPTSEMYMHLNAYRHNPDIVSTCHAHCLYLTSFATAGIEIDLAISPETALIVGKIPVAPFCCPGSRELADSVIPYVNKYHLVLLANHGPMTWGETPEEAWFRLEAAEAYAKSCVVSKYILNSARMMSKTQVEEVIQRLKFNISEEGKVKGTEKTDNQNPGISLSNLKSSGFSLEEDVIDRIADKLYERLCVKGNV